MPDKPRFVRELARVAAPGGRILIVTWCHRELRPGEQGLSKDELALLDKINKGMVVAMLHLPRCMAFLWCACSAAFYLPKWVPGSEYVHLAQELGLKDVRSADWSEHVVSHLNDVK